MPQTIKKTSQDAGERAANRRDDMLDVARRLFHDKGYASASMRDIANEIGVTQAALYYHFPNKEEMLFALIEEFTDRLIAVIDGAAAASADPEAALKATVREHILLGRSNHLDFKLVTEDKRHLNEVHAEALRLHERMVFGIYRDLVSAILTARGIAGRDASVAAFNTLGMINFVFNWYRPDGRRGLTEIAEETAAFAVAGLTGA